MNEGSDTAGAGKKALVVYYSRSGATKAVAEAIALMLSCDIEELIDRKKRNGPLGFVIAGKDAVTKKETEIAPLQKHPHDYGLVIVGTPVWAGTTSCAVRTYLGQQKENLPEVAFFLTTGGSGIAGTFGHMEELAGKAPVATLALKTKEVRKGLHGDRMREFVEGVKGRHRPAP